MKKINEIRVCSIDKIPADGWDNGKKVYGPIPEGVYNIYEVQGQYDKVLFCLTTQSPIKYEDTQYWVKKQDYECVRTKQS